MATYNKSTVSVASFNMHGFNNSWLYLQELTQNFQIIFVQEHWLSCSQLSYLNHVSSDFVVHSSSGMNEVCSAGLLRGRPFGGVAALIHSNISNSVKFIGASDDGRVITLMLDLNSSKFLLFGCYFPCDDNSSDFSNVVSAVLGYIESVVDEFSGVKFGLLGDLNFECHNNYRGYTVFKDFALAHNLICCDDLLSGDLTYSYHHDSLGHTSLLDHLFVQYELYCLIDYYDIISDGSNTSDHFPIVCRLTSTSNISQTNSVTRECPKFVREFRWDKCDTRTYYEHTRVLLERVSHDFPCDNNVEMCTCTDHHLDIDIYMSELVHILKAASNACVPSIPRSALKHYWSVELDELKEQSKNSYDMWIYYGRPRSGDIYISMQQSKLRYKQAIRQAVKSFENRFTDQLIDSFSKKDMRSFWKTWQFKNRRNSVSIPHVDGLVDSSDIAEHFKNKFSSLGTTCGSDDNINNGNVIGDIHASMYDGISIQGLLFNVEDVDTAIFSHLQRGKAPGLDSLSLEHFIHAHPLVIIHLNKLFNLLIRHGYVPNMLGEGVIVPLLKDKNGDISSSENYRAITINSVLAKIFETCMLHKFKEFFYSHDLQFGFKRKFGCNAALFSAQQVVRYFSSRGSCVHIACLDASKAFDRVLHGRLLSKMRERDFPECFVLLVSNWYSKLSSVVRWNGVYSSAFKVITGVCQGGILSPLYFNMYVDDLIHNLENSGFGCYIGLHFLGCFMYADDIILLSPSVCGLQCMLDKCVQYGVEHNILFNVKKSLYAVAGKKKPEFAISPCLYQSPLPRVDVFKYLGVYFRVEDVLKVDCGVIKRKFYSACNTLFQRTKYCSEPVKLQLVKSFCIPLITYCIGALTLSKNTLHQLCVCYNDAFRKIFSYKRSESVKELQYCCGDLPFEYLYDVSQWNFYISMFGKNAYLDCILKIYNCDNNFVEYFQCKYKPKNSTRFGMKTAVSLYFENHLYVQ